MICPFCGRNEKSTLEHVFGQQFERRFPTVAAHIEAVGDYAEPWAHDTVVQTQEGFVTRQVPRGSRTPELHQVKVKICDKCNNGWMADLDNRAVDVLEALTADRGFRRPTAQEGQAIALWLVKMGMAYDLYQPPAEKAYSDDLRHQFYATRDLPRGTTVYLGHEPSEYEWVPFWQYGWHLAPFNTPADVVINGPHNLGTTFFGMNGLRLVAHRIDPEVMPQARAKATEWLQLWMTRSRMVQIAPELKDGRYEPMEPNDNPRAIYTLREFVDRFTGKVAPSEE